MSGDLSIPQWKRDLILRRKNKSPGPGVLPSKSQGISSVIGSGSSSFSSRESLQVVSNAAGGSEVLDNNNWASVSCTMRLEPDGDSRSREQEDEELTYGPGIVNRLRSKYLNLTKENSSINFRRAASLEDLLGSSEISDRKFIKKPPPIKSERFRGSTRGNDSMKRARSVETLMRYQDQDPDIILVDRSVKIESKVTGLQKPKRLKPVLAETERPPPDLVKTTMRIFEATVKKVKPRGEVAVKVAAFKGYESVNSAGKGKKIGPGPLGLGKKPPKVAGKVLEDGVVVEKIVKVAQAVDKFQKISEPGVHCFKEKKKFEGCKGKFKIEGDGKLQKFQKVDSEPKQEKQEPEMLIEKLTKFSNSNSNSNIITNSNSISNLKPESEEKVQKLDCEEIKKTEKPDSEKLQSDPPKIEKLQQVEKVSNDKVQECENLIKIPEEFPKIQSEEFIEIDKVNFDKEETDCCEIFEDNLDGVKKISQKSREEISKAGESVKFDFNDSNEVKNYLPGVEEKEVKTNGVEKNLKKQIGIIRPLVSSKSLSSRELEKNLINRVKSIEGEPTKVVVSLKNAEEVKNGGLWDKPWNQQNNTMVFNFSNRKDVPDYIENDGLIIRRKREKTKGDGIIVLDATLDASTTDDGDWELSGGPPSPCDVAFFNDNVLINGRSNLSRSPRNHKHRIQFNDGATKTFEYPSEASMLEDEGTSVDGTSGSGTDKTDSGSLGDSEAHNLPQSNIANAAANPILGGGSLASFTPTKMDFTAESFELGVTRTVAPPPEVHPPEEPPPTSDELTESAAWGAEATADLLY